MVDFSNAQSQYKRKLEKDENNFPVHPEVWQVINHVIYQESHRVRLRERCAERSSF